MLKVQEIRELIRLIDHSTIDEFTFEHDGSKIKMKKNPVGSVHVEQSVQQPAVKELQTSKVMERSTPQAVAMEVVSEPEKTEIVEEANLYKITSPMVGTFYESSSPDTDAYVR